MHSPDDREPLGLSPRWSISAATNTHTHTPTPYFAGQPTSRYSAFSTIIFSSSCPFSCVNLRPSSHLHLGVRIQGVELGVQGGGFRVQGLGFRFRVGCLGLELRVQGLGCRLQALGCRVQGSGFRVQGSGFRVQGSGFRAQCKSPPSSIPGAGENPVPRQQHRPGGNSGANGWFLESTHIQMPPRRGGICGRLPQALPSTRLQGGMPSTARAQPCRTPPPACNHNALQRHHLQGYLAHNEHPPPRTLQ